MEMPTGKTIQTLRRQKGLTQEQLAEAVGVTAAAVSKMGDGQCLPGYSAAVPSGAGVGHHTRHTAGFSASSFRGRTESHL